MIEKIKAHLTLILVIIAVASSAMAGIKYLAPASRLAMVEQRLDTKIVSDNVRYLQDQIFQIEKEYRGREQEMPATTCDWLRRLKQSLEIEREKYGILLKKGK